VRSADATPALPQTTWFSGAAIDEPRELEFVAALSAAAEAGAFLGVGPKDTSSAVLDGGSGLLIGLAVPGLTCERRLLRVSFVPGDADETPVLRSEWSTQMTPLDPPGAYEAPGTYEGPTDGSDLWVSGIDATPAQCAAWVEAWMVRQLGRPVTRREWDRPTSGWGSIGPAGSPGPVAVEWQLGHPEGHLDSRGTFVWWWLVRRPPSRATLERP